MIKTKVLIPFTDKVTKQEYKKNDVIELTPQRFNEIRSNGNYIEAYVETEKVTTTTKK